MTTTLKSFRFLALLAIVVATVSSAFYFSGDKANAQGCTEWETPFTLEGNPFPPFSAGYAAWHAMYGESRVVYSSYQVARPADGDCGGGELEPTVTASLVAVPSSIAQGEQSSLSWSGMFATSCTGTNFSTGGATSGTIMVTPGSTTNYSVTCSNGVDFASASATVTVSASPPPPLICEDATYQIGRWFDGGTQTLLWTETGESASNGGGLNDNNLHMNLCIAECEAQGYGKCNYKFVNDLGQSQASRTSFSCYGVTGSPTLITRPVETGTSGIYANTETSYTAITIPSSCTTGDCVCNAIFYWNGSSWSLFQNTNPTPDCTLPDAPSGAPPADPSAGTVNLIEYRDGLIYWGSTDGTYPATSAHDTYDRGSCPLPQGPNLTAGRITPTTATVNAATMLSSVISNTGTVTTGASFINLFQIDNNADHTSVTATRVDTSPVVLNGATDTSTASYTFTTVGTWYARACADMNAAFATTITESDENDNCGAWTPITVSNTTTGVTSCTVSPSTITAGGSVTWSATPTTAAPYVWAPSEGGSNTTPAATYTRSYATAGTYGMSVTAGGATRACPNITVNPVVPSCGTPNPSITANPDRVNAGSTSTLTVSASGVDTTCTVRNVNTGTTLQTLSATSCNIPSTTIVTGSLTTQTTFAVTCGTVTEEVVVNVIPNFDEF